LARVKEMKTTGQRVPETARASVKTKKFLLRKKTKTRKEEKGTREKNRSRGEGKTRFSKSRSVGKKKKFERIDGDW